MVILLALVPLWLMLRLVVFMKPYICALFIVWLSDFCCSYWIFLSTDGSFCAAVTVQNLVMKPFGSILYYVRTVLFVLQTYNLVWVILWQIRTVLAGRLGCGPFSLMLTTWYIVCQGSEPNGETSQFLTGSILYYVRIAATTLLAWPRIWSSVITTRIAWVNNALIAHNSQKGYWQFFIS